MIKEMHNMVPGVMEENGSRGADLGADLIFIQVRKGLVCVRQCSEKVGVKLSQVHSFI